VAVVVKRFDVFLVSLDPTVGSKIQKSRPCLIISPDEMNRHIRTVIIAPMTTRGRRYPTRVACEFQGKQGQIVLDQIRTVDKSRLLGRLGRIDSQTQMHVLSVLQDMFAP
jgi:mRNA interferase MazF